MINQIVVLAGGLATRLYPLTATLPKSMIPVQGEPFIAHQLRLFKRNGITDVVLCVGTFADQIKAYVGNGQTFGLRTTYSHEETKLDTGGALKKALPHLAEQFFVIYGDSYLDYPYQAVAADFKARGRSGLMTVYKNNNRLEPSRIIVNGSHVEKYQKNPPPPGAQHMEYGLNIFSRDVLATVPETVFPISHYFDYLAARQQLLAHEVPTRFYEIGSPKGLAEVRSLLT